MREMTEAEFREKDREYFELVGRKVMYGDQALPIIAFQWLRFGAGHLFTLQLPDGREMGAQRDQFYVLPTHAELTGWLQEIFTADPGGTSYDTAAEELLLLLTGEVS